MSVLRAIQYRNSRNYFYTKPKILNLKLCCENEFYNFEKKIGQMSYFGSVSWLGHIIPL